MVENNHMCSARLAEISAALPLTGVAVSAYPSSAFDPRSSATETLLLKKMELSLEQAKI